MITDGDGKINSVETTMNQLTSKYFTDATGAFVDLKKIRKLRFCFQEATLYIGQSKQHYSWQYPHDCAEENP
jgi:hypothetical protein